MLRDPVIYQTTRCEPADYFIKLVNQIKVFSHVHDDVVDEPAFFHNFISKVLLVQMIRINNSHEIIENCFLRVRIEGFATVFFELIVRESFYSIGKV